MPGRLRTGSATTRRRFLTTLASASATTVAAPAFSLSPQRPIVTHGVQSGDVSVDSGMVWARADRPARVLIEAATTDSFKNIWHASFADALPETDFTAKALIEAPTGRARHFLPAAISGSLVGASRQRANRRAFSHRVGRATLDFVRVVRRHRGPGMGYRPFARWHAHISDDASQ